MKKIIMIVDNDENLRKSIRLVLEENGYSVLEAVNTNDAWTKIQITKPDLILLDLLMLSLPSSGEFVYNLGSSKEYASIKVIYITAVEKVRKSSNEKNVYEVIEKPFENEELISKIKNVLEKKWKEK